MSKVNGITKSNPLDFNKETFRSDEVIYLISELLESTALGCSVKVIRELRDLLDSAIVLT